MNSVGPPINSDRDLRQRDIVPAEKLKTCHAVVIGVGAIGRQVAWQLAALGIARLTLFDDDRVGSENLAPQGYWEEDVGEPKVERTGTLCCKLFPRIDLTLCAERFKRSTAKTMMSERPLAVFACVDSISTRRMIWEALRHRAAFFTDGRMSAEVIRVLAVDGPKSAERYAGSLFQPDEAHVGPCTARSTI